MEARLTQQMKKGVLEMLVLHLICKHPAYGYELLTSLKAQSGGLFPLKEGTLYPILYRLEDDGLITSQWSQGQGRSAPKKVYRATEEGIQENQRHILVWQEFSQTVSSILREEEKNDSR